jgi:glycosyltransferase involved in cell wall biosynthesis
MKQDKHRLKILFLTAWYPSEVSPEAGAPIKEHAKAASLYNDIAVLYAYPTPLSKPWKFCQASESIEDGIRTIRVKYNSVFLDRQRKLTIKSKKEDTSFDSRNKSVSTFKKVSRILVMATEDLLYYWCIFTSFRKLVNERWRPDVIHAHVFTAGVPAILIGWFYRIPVVITERFSVFPLHILTPPERMKAIFAMNMAQVVLPVSNYLRSHIEVYKIKTRFIVIPNVVNTEIFYPSSSQNERSNNKKRLLLVAFLRPVKGISYLLEALSQIKEERRDFILDIVGDGPNRSEYEKLARELGLNGIVEYHGLKPKEVVANFMRECAFLVQPSLVETFGVVYIEAMACGKPVIATNTGGPEEIVNREVGILVQPKDVEALVRAIKYMLDNYTDYSSEKITKYVRERFSYEVVGSMLNNGYRELVPRKKEQNHEETKSF